MRMTAIEKYFVNRASHAHSVADHALQLLNRVNYQSGWRYLEVGCGMGSAPREVAAATDLSVLGVDIDPRQIEVARNGPALPNLQYRVMDATKLGFRDGQFDMVASQMTTHHIPDWERALWEMCRVLRAGGYLIYRDFMFPPWLTGIGRRLFRFMGFPSIAALHSLAANAGLTKVYESQQAGKVDTIWVKND
jgi:ubiquinone/menaquinone biosynthesis C-methylase UbiE